MAEPVPLRKDLVVIEQVVDGAKSYVVKDPARQTYFRFGEEDFYVLSLCDGKKPAKEIAWEVNNKFNNSLSPKDIRDFLQRLEKDDLFERTPEQENTFLYEKMKEDRRSKVMLAKGSFLYFRVPLIDPDKLLDKLIPYFRWIYQPTAVVLFILFILSAVVQLAFRSTQVTEALAYTFDFSSRGVGHVIALWAMVMTVIAIHELGHGLTCKNFGGHVHEIGFLFMMFMPCMYCNVNDAWLFSNKNHRFYVTFAGCYIEIFVGSIAVYLWLLSQPGSTLNILAFQAVSVCFFSSLFMNFNPLMKFDGYFAFSDWMQVSNLKNRSKDYLYYYIRTRIFRLEEQFPEDLSPREKKVLGIYGLLSTLYITNMMAGLLYMLSSALISFTGIWGALLLGVIAYKIGGAMLKKFVTFLQRVRQEHKHIFMHPYFNRIAAAVGILCLYAFFFHRFDYVASHQATLEPMRQQVLRAAAPGFVSFLDQNKQYFHAGELIVEQNDAQLSSELEQRILDKKTAELQLQAAFGNRIGADITQMKNTVEKLDQDIKNIKHQISAMRVEAPFDGVFVQSGNVAFRTMQKGAEFGRLIDTSVYKAVINVPENQLENVKEGMAAALILDSVPEKLAYGTITLVSPVFEQLAATRTYAVTVEFPNDANEMRAGFSGTVYLYLGKYTPLQRSIQWLHKTLRLDFQL